MIYLTSYTNRHNIKGGLLYIPSGEPTPPQPTPPYEDYLWFENYYPTDLTISLNPSNLHFTKLHYSYDGQNWTPTTNMSYQTNQGQRLYLSWEDLSIIVSGASSPALFNVSNPYKMGGKLNKGNYNYLFIRQSQLTDAGELELTNMSPVPYGYQYMFAQTTTMEVGPKVLPATNFTSEQSGVYNYMFYYSAVQEAPEIKLRTCEGYGAMANMFRYAQLKNVKFDIEGNFSSYTSRVCGNCTNLQSVTFTATTPPTISSAMFQNSSVTFKIYVPAESVAAYKSATVFSQYASRIFPIE